MASKLLMICDKCGTSVEMPENGAVEGWGLVRVSVGVLQPREQGVPTTENPVPRLKGDDPRELCPSCIGAVRRAAGSIE